MREEKLRAWIASVHKAYGIPKAPITLTAMEQAHRNGAIGNLVLLVRNSLHLPLKIKLATVRSGGNEKSPAWIDFPVPFPVYGSSEFESSMVTLFIRKQFIETASTNNLVFAVAHELSHVVLEATHHEFRKVEEVVDLTAMWLGYSEVYRKGYIHSVNQTNFNLGYLKAHEVLFTNLVIRQMRSKMATIN